MVMAMARRRHTVAEKRFSVIARRMRVNEGEGGGQMRRKLGEPRARRKGDEREGTMSEGRRRIRNVSEERLRTDRRHRERESTQAVVKEN